VHKDPLGVDPQAFAAGLNKAVYNFMHGIGTAFPLQEWFDVPVPAISVQTYDRQAGSQGAAG